MRWSWDRLTSGRKCNARAASPHGPLLRAAQAARPARRSRLSAASAPIRKVRSLPRLLAQRGLAYQQYRNFGSVARFPSALLADFRAQKEREMALRQRRALLLRQTEDSKGCSTPSGCCFASFDKLRWNRELLDPATTAFGAKNYKDGVGLTAARPTPNLSHAVAAPDSQPYYRGKRAAQSRCRPPSSPAVSQPCRPGAQLSALSCWSRTNTTVQALPRGGG